MASNNYQVVLDFLVKLKSDKSQISQFADEVSAIFEKVQPNIKINKDDLITQITNVSTVLDSLKTSGVDVESVLQNLSMDPGAFEEINNLIDSLDSIEQIASGIDLSQITSSMDLSGIEGITQAFAGVDSTALSAAFEEAGVSINNIAMQAQDAAVNIQSAMTEMANSGQAGSEGYAALEAELTNVNGLIATLGTVPPIIKPIVEIPSADVPAKAVGESAGTSMGEGLKAKFGATDFKGMVGGVLQVFGGDALMGGVQSVVGGFKEVLESGKHVVEMNERLEIGFKQAGLTGKGLEDQMSSTSTNASKLSNEFAISAQEIKGYSQQAAFVGGVTGKMNADVTELAAGLVKASGGMLDSTQIIRTFTRGVGDPEAVANMGRLKMAFPALATALKGITQPAEMTKKAMEFLAPTFSTLKEQALGPIGSMERLKNSLDATKANLGKGLIEAFAPLLTGFSNILIPAIQSGIKGISSFFNILKENATTITIVATVLGGFAAAIWIANGGLVAMGNSSAKAAMELLEKLLPSISAVTVGQTLMNAAMLAAPWALAAVAIAAVVAMMVVMTKTQSELLAGEVKASEAEVEAMQAREKSINKNRELLQSHVSLVDSFKATGESAMKDKELMEKLEKAYPGVIDETKSFAENLNNLEKAADGSRKSIKQMNDEIIKLKNKEIHVTVVTDKKQIMAAEQDLFKLFSAVNAQHGDQIAIKFNAEIDNAKGSVAIQTVLNRWTNDVKSWKLPPNAEQELISAMNATAKRQKEINADFNKGKMDLTFETDKQIRASRQDLVKAGNEDEIAQLTANALKKNKLTKDFTKKDVYFYLDANQKRIDAENKQAGKLDPLTPPVDPKPAETLLEQFNKLYAVKKDMLDNDFMIYETIVNTNAAMDGRQLNDTDSLLLNERKLMILNKQRDTQIELAKSQGIEFNAATNMFDFGKVNITDKDKSEYNKKLLELTKSASSVSVELNAQIEKIKISNQALNDAQMALDEQKLEYDISIGLNVESSKKQIISKYKDIMNNISKDIENEKNKLANLVKPEEVTLDIVLPANATAEEQKALLDKQETWNNYATKRNEISTKIVALGTKELESQKKIDGLLKVGNDSSLEENAKYWDERLAKLATACEKERAMVEHNAQVYAASLDKAQSKANDSLTKSLEKEQADKMAVLDSMREQESLSAEGYEYRKSELEKDIANKRTEQAEQFATLQILNEKLRAGQLAEIDRQELEAKRDALKQQQALMVDTKMIQNKDTGLFEFSAADQAAYDKITVALESANKAVTDKGSILQETMNTLSTGVTDAMSNLFAGDADGAVNSLKGAFAQILGVFTEFISKMVSGVILQAVLGQTQALLLTNPLAIVLMPVVYTVVKGAVGALINPLLGSMKMNTGGYIDKPTTITVGDANVKSGENREWVLRNDQMKQVVSSAVSSVSNMVMNEIVNLQKILVNQKLTTVLAGADIQIALVRENAITNARAR